MSDSRQVAEFAVTSVAAEATLLGQAQHPSAKRNTPRADEALFCTDSTLRHFLRLEKCTLSCVKDPVDHSCLLQVSPGRPDRLPCIGWARPPTLQRVGTSTTPPAALVDAAVSTIKELSGIEDIGPSPESIARQPVKSWS